MRNCLVDKLSLNLKVTKCVFVEIFLQLKKNTFTLGKSKTENLKKHALFNIWFSIYL